MHWTSVILLVILILTATAFEDLEAGTTRTDFVRQHASFGLLFLLVMSLRLLWRCNNPNPINSYKIQDWQKFSAHFLHWGIYVVMFTQSILGLLNLISAGLPISFFGLFEIPALTVKNVDWHELFTSAHFFLSIVIYPLIAIHLSAAIYHQLFGVLDD